MSPVQRMTVAETVERKERKAAILTENIESHSSIIIRSFDHGAHRGSPLQGKKVEESSSHVNSELFRRLLV